ncbi:MAG: chorismate-binding protein [candidate division Zixibacteria bacterium]|nr:chorismate-binding protein [candidate division Zixibacteria bacterium]
MTFTDFRRSLREHGLVILSTEIPSDLLTPASVFLRLGGDKADCSFLFESVETGGAIGRYSFIGVGPTETISFGEQGGTHLIGKKRSSLPIGQLPRIVRSRLCASHREAGNGADGLSGGWIGYFGYDWVRTLERLPTSTPDRLGHPWVQLGLYDEVVVFDHLYQSAKINVAIRANAESHELAPRQSYDRASRRLDRLNRILSQPLELPRLLPAKSRPIRSNMTPREFTDGVKTIKRHIGRGDIFQCVLSQRFMVEGTTKPFDVYRRLRRANPSPYLYFLKFGDLAIAGSSPETLVRKIGNRVTTRPIAGTRPRGADQATDMQLERQLLASAKENAEHLMLVDLGRNDLGRVCRPGTIATTEFRRVDRFSHVMHMVSVVEGKPRPNVDALDVLAATFPAGTVTGAPKIRAMEIIDTIEPDRRGIYAGCIGYIDWWGNLDTAIAIRTAVMDRHGAYAQAGAGIVADSDPMREYRETQNKAAAPLASLGGVWKRGGKP